MRNSLSVPWMGTMLDGAMLQKLVRVASCAAICGLSISFIVGEAIDKHAAKLTTWKADNTLLPVGYLPLNPLLSTAVVLTQEKLANALYASNAPAGAQPVDPPMMITDALKALMAAPALTALPGTMPSKAAQKPVPTNIWDGDAELQKLLEARMRPAEPEERIGAAEVEDLLVTISSATSKLAMEQPGRGGAVIESGLRGKGIEEEVAPEPEATPKKTKRDIARIPSGEVISINDLAETEDLSSPELVPGEETILGNGVQEEGEWNIRGRVSAGYRGTETGHYEVGLFSKIDQDGLPVGFPLAQKILPAGVNDFELRAPKNLAQGYLFGSFISTKTGKRSWIAPPVNPWTRQDRQFAELVLKQEDRVSSIAAASTIAKDTLRVHGTVSTLFARDGQPIPQAEVVVKVRGRKESARTDRAGGFSIEVPRLKGSIQLEFLKAGYHPSLIEVPADGDVNVKVELASRDAIEQIARRIGFRQVSSRAVFLGKALNSDGTPNKGLSIRMSQKADGPFYFGEDGFPSTTLKATSSDGRFLFLNVEPGSGFVESFQNGESIAPFLLSTVEGGELVMKNLSATSGSISGRLFNPVSETGKLLPVTGARVRLQGSSDWANTDSFGAFSVGPMKWMKGERVALEFSAEKFNNHRYLLTPGEGNELLNLYAFPATYLGRLAKSMDVDLDSDTGVVMGKVSNLSVRVDALADHSQVNAAKDFYFDAKGKLRGSHTMTDPRYGTYVIFNVPRGRVLLQGNDSAGALRYSDSVVSSPASISIVMD